MGDQIRELDNSVVDFLHYDVIDGDFARDFTKGSSIIEVIEGESKLPSDFHLMVEEPSRIFEMFNFDTEPLLQFIKRLVELAPGHTQDKNLVEKPG